MPHRFGTPRPDLCVIGGGTAGHALAMAAAALGARCTLIDARARLGRGQASDLAETLFFAAATAHERGRPFDLAALRDRIGQALAAQAPSYAAARLRSLGVTVITGTAAFADPRTVVVGGDGIRARRFVLATGAAAAAEGGAASTLRDRVDSSDLLACVALPAALAIHATTPAGLEWAQALARLGSAVTLRCQPGATAPFDPELVDHVLAALRRDGVAILPTEATFPPAAVPAMMVGRGAPAIAGLALATAGIALVDGAPHVDGALRTTNARVFAIGDVLGAHTAGAAAIPTQMARVLRGALFRQPVRASLPPVPLALRTAPALAQVGTLTLDAARGAPRILRFPLGETAGGAGLAGAGGVKLVATAHGTILGAGIVAPGAADAIVPWSMAIATGLPLQRMAGLAVPPASVADGGRRAALGFVTTRLRSPWIRRLIGWARHLP